MKPDALPRDKEKQLELYSISEAEFKVAPAELKPYNPGVKINRDNFINFLILSFAISMGQPKVQILFMKWLKLKFSFDYEVVLDNLKKAGGFKGLSVNEKRHLKISLIE